jgi:hypothetical protein
MARSFDVGDCGRRRSPPCNHETSELGPNTRSSVSVSGTFGVYDLNDPIDSSAKLASST